MVKWSEIIEKHKEQLIEALEQAFKEAVDCRYMQFVVELNSDGETKIKEYPAGESNISYAAWKGINRIIHTFCFQNMDIFPEEYKFRDHMSLREQEKAERESDEECMTFREYIYNSGKYAHLIEEVEHEWLEEYKEKYAYITACTLVRDAIMTESEWEELA